jgi:chemotaxis protein MotB
MEKQYQIIRKVKKPSHQGAHGGSWKVAYADFVTAMMAFFLLLWLITMVSDEKRAKVSTYFKNFSIFEKGGSTMVDYMQKPGGMINVLEVDGVKRGVVDPQNKGSEEEEERSVEQIKEILSKEVASQLGDLKDQVMVGNFDGGLKVEIIDKSGSPMFASGSREITAEGKKVLEVIAENLRKSSGKIAIEGHTDARQYVSGSSSNWELSTERAGSARRELEKYGVNSNRLIRISGFAATDPLIKEDPYDPRNRRISIRLFQTPPPPKPVGSETSSKSPPGGTDTSGEKPKPPERSMIEPKNSSVKKETGQT